MSNYLLATGTKEEILSMCQRIAFPCDIVAACFYGPHACGYADRESDVDVLLIVASTKLTLKCHLESCRDRKLSVLMVDERSFEADVDGDILGGLLVENILTPYEPLLNNEYLWDKEVRAKKRMVTEILGNMVTQSYEMSHELLIQPEFFVFESMMRKASLFPPITYRFLNISRSDSKDANLAKMLRAFNIALKSLSNEGYVALCGEHVKITKEYISAIQRRKLRIVYLFKAIRSGVMRHTLKVFPGMMRSFVEEHRLYSHYFVREEDSLGIPLFKLEDPNEYVFLQTALGPVSLSDKTTIEDFVRRKVPYGHTLEFNVKKLGGVLNTVYVLGILGDKEQKFVVKVFKDWYGWKWFPLALWALGTKGFAVSGKSRLEKEYTIDKFLSERGVGVPKIIYVSPKDRLIFEEYIDGIDFARIVKQMCESEEKRTMFAEAIRQAGSEIAGVHNLGVTLGDCKPENIIRSTDQRIYFIDLEQAEMTGDQTWDVAEFLYYVGHHASLSPMKTVRQITEEFLRGYFEGGGEMETVKRIGSPKYMKVFSFFTPPHLLLAISSTCEETLKDIGSQKL